MGAPRGKVVRSMVPSEPLSEQQRVQDEQWLQDEQRRRISSTSSLKRRPALAGAQAPRLDSIPRARVRKFPLTARGVRAAAGRRAGRRAHALAHEERAGACFAVLRGLSEHVAAEFRPLLD